jgi:hypothetical protein
MMSTYVFVGDQSRHIIDLSRVSLHVDLSFAANLENVLQK